MQDVRRDHEVVTAAFKALRQRIALDVRAEAELFDRFLSAAARLDALAAKLAARDRAESELLKQRALAASTAGAVLGPALVLVAGSILLWLALRPVSRLARTVWGNVTIRVGLVITAMTSVISARCVVGLTR